MRRPRSVGQNVRRKEGFDKLTGAAKYVADVATDAWTGLTLRSPHAHAKIVRIVKDPAFDWREAVVVTAADLKSHGWENVVQLIVDDQPFLAEHEVNHPEEPVALVAAPTRERAEEAARHVTVEYEKLAPQLDFEKAGTVFKHYLVEKGDARAAEKKAARVIEGSYSFGAQEQAYIENNGVIAWATDGSVRVDGSLQCPYYVHKALKRLFKHEAKDVRVVQMTTGGGFGGKEEYPNLLAGHAAILAKISGHAVKMLYDRAEDMVATTKRHPGRIRHRTGVTRDGKLVSMDIEVVFDGGAYATLSAVVLSRGTIHAAGPYRCSDIRIESRVVKTHTPPNGAFRGFGVPQACFAIERHLDVVAAELGIDPVLLRRRNLLRDGETTATGQPVQDAGASHEAFDAALAKSRFAAKRKEIAAFNRKSTTHRRGIGLASFFHGTGFTGGGELYLMAEAGVRLTDAGTVEVLAASTEIGQGTRTAFAQIVADTIGIEFDLVNVATPDTDHVPDSGPTVASRTIAIVGRIVADAALDLDAALRSHAGLDRATPWTTEKFRVVAKRWLAQKNPARFLRKFGNPSKQQWDDKTYRGDAYGAYAWACVVAEVEVDLGTYEVRVSRITSAQEIGRAIHPRLAEGQIEGGTTQAMGWALMEDVVMRDGRMANGQLTNYIIPTSMETPPIDVILLERPYEHGPFGAKGIGELPMDGGAPAIVNAIVDAIGVQLTQIPATPERILTAVTLARAKAVPRRRKEIA